MSRTTAVLRTVVLLCLCLLVASPAAAHSFSRKAKPMPDSIVEHGLKRVTVWFNEPVEAEFATIAVKGRNGRRVDVGAPFKIAAADDALAVRLRRDLPKGRYRVQWRVLSADSHIQQGAFAFRLRPPAAARHEAQPPKGEPAREPAKSDARAGKGHPEAAMPADQAAEQMPQRSAGTSGGGPVLVAAARGLTLTGLLLLVGVLTFWLVAWRGLHAAVSARPPSVEATFLQRASRITTVAVALTIVSTIVWVVAQGAAAADMPLGDALSTDVLGGVLTTGFGKAAVARIVLLEGLLIAAVLWRLLPGRAPVPAAHAVGAAALQPAVGGAHLAALVVVLVPLLLTMSLVSHAVTTRPIALHVTADVIHLAAAGAWIGGLVVLLTAAFPVSRPLGPAERVAVLGPVIVRFSRIAAVSVFLVATTGAIRGWAAVGSWSGLTTSAYGQALLTKVGIFAVLLCLGAVNHFWTVRRVRRAAETAGHTTALGILRRTVFVETTLATVIVIVTAVLVNLPAPTM